MSRRVLVTIGVSGMGQAITRRVASGFRVLLADYDEELLVWGRRGARINSISPGIISTPQGHDELAGASGDSMRAMIDGSPTGRMGTPGDIAAAAAFLLSQDADFITGTDLLVDGGTVAGIRLAANPQSILAESR